jgi:hypothetical protein
MCRVFRSVRANLLALRGNEFVQSANGVFESVVRRLTILPVFSAVNSPMSDCNVENEIRLATVTVTFCLGGSHLP